MNYKAYTYLIHHIPTNMFYYGVRWQNIRLQRLPENDLWVEYFTRSKYVHNLISEYGKDSFRFEIRKTFDNIQNARNWETKVLKRMKVLLNPDIWINRTDNVSILNITHPRGTLGKKLPFNKGCSENNKIVKIGNEYTKNTIWINNGIIRKMIPKNDPIPDGYVRGSNVHTKRPDLAEYNRTKHPNLRTMKR